MNAEAHEAWRKWCEHAVEDRARVQELYEAYTDYRALLERKV